MKLLQVTATGLPLFKSEFKMSFYASQRVSDFDKGFLRPLGKEEKYYVNCAHAIIGINASGKTSALKVILLALDIVNNSPINHSEAKDILGETNEAVFTIDFLSNNDDVCRLETNIACASGKYGSSYQIVEETLWVKPLSSVATKKTLVDFSHVKPCATRSKDMSYLSDDVSIVISHNKMHNQHIVVESYLSLANVDCLSYVSSTPAEIVRFLDPTIEHLFFEKKRERHYGSS